MSLPICQNKSITYIRHRNNSRVSAPIAAKREAQILLQNYYHSTHKYLCKWCQQIRPYSAIYYNNLFSIINYILETNFQIIVHLIGFYAMPFNKVSNIWLKYLSLFLNLILWCFDLVLRQYELYWMCFQPYLYYLINNYSNITQMLHTLFSLSFFSHKHTNRCSTH
jgi:hypothetical protein